MNDADAATPVKLRLRGEDVGITTPSGGLIFNPFHKDIMSRVGHITFSPGIFTYAPSPIENSDSMKTTPNRMSVPFMLSPDTQADLFPVDIDENPILQLKLQEKLNTQCDDDLQDTIHSFFKSHLIAPSPDRINEFQLKPPNNRKYTLPRTSSLLPAVAQRQLKKLSNVPQKKHTSRSEVAIQTALSIPYDFDLEALLHHCLHLRPTDKESDSDEADQVLNKELQVKKNVLAETVDVNLQQGSPVDSSISLTPSRGVISLSACAVERVYSDPFSPPTSRAAVISATDKEEDIVMSNQVLDPRSTPSLDRYFLCVSCRESHSLTNGSRRAGHFSQSLVQLDENDGEEDMTTTQTRVDNGSSRSHCRRTIITSIGEGGGIMDDHSDYCITSSTRCNSLVDQERMHQSATCSTHLSGSAIVLPREDEELSGASAVSAADLSSPSFNNFEDCQAHSSFDGAMCSSPSPPLCGNQMDYSISRDVGGTVSTKTPITLCDRSRQQRVLVWSPTILSQKHRSMSFQSPDISPILPVSRTKQLVMKTSREEHQHVPIFDEALSAPSVRLFSSPEGELSPIPTPSFRLHSPDRLYMDTV